MKKKSWKRITARFLALLMALSVSTTAFAMRGETDITAAGGNGQAALLSSAQDAREQLPVVTLDDTDPETPEVPDPAPAPEPEPEPEITPEPVATEAPTQEPTAQPEEPTPEPTQEPEPSAAPTEQPEEPTPEPSAEPEAPVTPEPSETPAPSETPEPTEEPDPSEGGSTDPEDPGDEGEDPEDPDEGDEEPPEEDEPAEEVPAPVLPDLAQTVNTASLTAGAAAGQTVTYTLTSHVPVGLSAYLAAHPEITGVLPVNVEEAALAGIAVEEWEDPTVLLPLAIAEGRDVCVLVWKGDLTAGLQFNNDVTITLGEDIDLSGCFAVEQNLEDATFAVSLDLAGLSSSGIAGEALVDGAPLTVTYTATFGEQAKAGIYTSDTWAELLCSGAPEAEVPETADAEVPEPVSTMLGVYDIAVSKYDQTDHMGLRGAKFGLYADKDCTDEIAQLTSDSDGELTFASLVAGTYYLKELEAPLYYLQSQGVLTLTIEEPTDPDVSTLIKISFPSVAAPNTGSNSLPLCTAVGFQLMLLSLGYFLFTRKREELF